MITICEVGHLHHYRTPTKMHSLITGRIPLVVERVGFVMESTHHSLRIFPTHVEQEW